MFRRLWNWSRGVVWLSVLAILWATAGLVCAVLGVSWVIVVALVGMGIVLALISS